MPPRIDGTGATSATSPRGSTPAPLVIGQTTIPAGAYTLYIVAGESGAKLAFSSNIAKWGIPVDDKHEVTVTGLELKGSEAVFQLQ